MIWDKLPNDLGTDLFASQQAELDQRWAESKKDPSAAFRRPHPLGLDALYANVIVVHCLVHVRRQRITKPLFTVPLVVKMCSLVPGSKSTAPLNRPAM
ncbi:MAG: hypothetical protein MUF23_04760 [Pirellula sp.]|nr:hypothetical protein [Pirellula sp.]